MDKIILITLLAVNNILWYAICYSQAKDIKGYEYAVDYIISHPEDDGRLEYRLNGMAEALEKGFIQEYPPRLVKDCK